MNGIEACFNCTKRRIICDLTPNKCKKCEKKGLECPGYGVRYRFTNGQTVSRSETGPSEGSGAATTQSTRRRNSLKWVNGSKRARKRPGGEAEASDLIPGKPSDPEGAAGSRGGIDEVHDQQRVNNERTNCRDDQASSSLRPVVAVQTEYEEQNVRAPQETEPSVSHEGNAVIEVTRDDWLPAAPALSTPILKLLPFLSNRDPRMRLLFDHCMSAQTVQPSSG